MGFQLNRQLNISIFILLVGLVLVGKLFYIQVLDKSYRLSADNNVLRHVVQYPARGIIYDRQGEILVRNDAVYDLMVVPSQVKPFDTVLLARLLDLDVPAIREALASARSYSFYKESLFAKQLPPSMFGRLEELLYMFPGFYALPRTVRTYPQPIAAHLVGYVGEVSKRKVLEDPYYRAGDYIGISGLEYSYEEELRGRNGVRTYLVDVHNRIKGSYASGRYDTVAIAGNDLYLSLHAGLQTYGERLMRERRGGLVALDPRNGEILAMVSTPTYDPNLLVGRVRTQNFRALDSVEGKPLFNRPIMALYPPGSTFKVVNALIGLGEGVAHPNTGYACHGRFPIGRGVGCHSHPYAENLAAAIRMSCNSYFCYVFRNIMDSPRYGGIEGALDHWRGLLGQMGFGHPLGVDLPGELAGIVPTTEYYDRYFRKGHWNSLTIISLAIGQGELGTTPLQMANLAATIANRGHYFQPHVVRRVKGPSLDSVIRPARHDIRIDSTHYEIIVDGMSQAVSGWGMGGTAWRAYIPGVEVCGKTGTAQNPHGEDHSVFIAFAPRDNPRIAIAVYLENEGFGGTWAAPIAGLMMEKYLKDTVTNLNMERFVINKGWN